jgi:ribosomal protein S13
MGSGGSKNQNITLEAVNEAITNVVTTQTDTTDIVISANNTMLNIEFGPNAKLINGCTFDASQQITSTSDIYRTTKFKDLTDLQDKIKSALDEKIKASDDLKQEAFATALNVKVDKNEIKSKARNLVEKNITSSTLRNFNSAAGAVNSKGNFVFNGICDGSTIDISQTILQKQLVTLLSDDLVKNTGTSDQDSSQTGDSSDDSKTKQKGASDFMRSIGDAIGNIMKGPVVVIAITIVVLAILAFIFRKSISKVAEKKAGVSFGSKIKKMFNAIKKM